MWLVFVALFLTATVFLSYASGDFQLNPQALLVNETEALHHNKTSRYVTIKLASTRKCVRPTFMVRLSGPSLYLLDPIHTNHTQLDVVAFTYPHLHEAGQYFLEVISLYCETLNPHHFQSMCLTNPLDGKNVLNLPYSFEVVSTESSPRLRPRWVLSHNATPALLPTRYQKMCGGSFCSPQDTDIAQHNLYEWTDKPPYEHLTLKTFQRGLSNLTHAPSGKESITICMIGASHAYNLAEHGNNLKITHVNFAFELTRYPELFDVRSLANCTYAVLSYGQWLLSEWMGKVPYSADRYEVALRRIMKDVVAYASTSNTKVFMRSMNLNGLGWKYFACPALEFRHPPLIMMYNSVMSKLCAEYHVPYIDTHHLQGPLWDIALDWNHPRGRVFTAEAEYIVHYVMSYSHSHNLPVLLDPDFAARVKGDLRPQPIRFSDSPTEYILQGGEFRAYPDAATRFHLGYTSANTVTVYNASLKENFKIGSPLPVI